LRMTTEPAGRRGFNPPPAGQPGETSTVTFALAGSRKVSIRPRPGSRGKRVVSASRADWRKVSIRPRPGSRGKPPRSR